MLSPWNMSKFSRYLSRGLSDPVKSSIKCLVCVGQVGSPLPAPAPVRAPGPDTARIAHVLNGSSAPAHAPVLLPSSRTDASSPQKAKGAVAKAVEMSGPAARPPAPIQAAPTPVAAPETGFASTSSPRPTAQNSAASMSSPSVRDAMSYTAGAGR